MSKSVEIIVIDQTKAIKSSTFNKVAIVSFTENQDYTVVSSTEEITEGNEKLLAVAKVFLAQDNAGEVAVYGVDRETTEKTIDQILDAHASEFYGLLCTSNDPQEIISIANWASANEKLFIVTPAPETTTVDLVGMAKDINSGRVAIYAHAGDSLKKHQPLDAGIAGVCFPMEVGSVSWSHKSPNLVAAYGYKRAEEALLEAGNVNYLGEEYGTYITKYSYTTNGSHTDICRAKDFAKARLGEAVFGLLARMAKVPYSDAGIALVRKELKLVLEDMVVKGIIHPEYVISVPTFANIPTNTRAQRILENVKIDATILSPIEKVKVQMIFNV